jgi:hypothetical protein
MTMMTIKENGPTSRVSIVAGFEAGESSCGCQEVGAGTVSKCKETPESLLVEKSCGAYETKVEQQFYTLL